MTVQAYRSPGSASLFGGVWTAASNSIARRGTAGNMTIPSNYGKNNRDFTVTQNDFDYTARLVSAGLGWIAPVEALWGGGRMLDGNPPTGPHLSPAEIACAALTDLGISNLAMILHAQGGAGIVDYAGAVGSDAKTWFDARVADAPGTFVMRFLVGEFGFPDMSSPVDAGNVPANLDTWEGRYRNSGVPGAESFLTFVFDQHNAFIDQSEYETVRDNTRTWVSADPRRFLISTADILSLTRTRLNVGPPPDYPNDPHWTDAIIQRAECAARAIFDAFTLPNR